MVLNNPRNLLLVFWDRRSVRRASYLWPEVRHPAAGRAEAAQSELVRLYPDRALVLGVPVRRSRQHRYSVQFPERGWHDGQVTVSKRIETAWLERRALARVSRAAWRLDQAERERT
jgi:hypothetical protein